MKMNKPEIRFSGFSGEWGNLLFRENFDNIPNNTLSRADLNIRTGLVKNIHYGDILIKFGELLDVKKEVIPFITDDTISTKLRSNKLQNGDVIIADAAEDETVGKCTELINIKDEIVISGLHTIAVRPKVQFAPKYLGYYMNSSTYHNQLLRLMQGTKVLSISKSAIKDTLIWSPSDKLEQTQIGNFFQNLDQLISLHQKKYDKLVILKKAMLEKMFPKPGTKVPEIRFKGFEGDWVEKKLGEVAESFEYGLNAASKTYDGKNKYLRITDINDATNLFDKSDLTSPNINLSNAENYKLKSGDILFARTGASVGKSYIYKDSDGLVYFAGFLIRARINSEANAEFIFQNTLTDRYADYIRLTSQRSGQPGVNAQEYSNFSIMFPELAEQNLLANYFQKLDSLIVLEVKQLEKLKNIKKACLEKMFV
jgi:type I restriction enzyme S subunit